MKRQVTLEVDVGPGSDGSRCLERECNGGVHTCDRWNGSFMAVEGNRKLELLIEQPGGAKVVTLAKVALVSGFDRNSLSAKQAWNISDQVTSFYPDKTFIGRLQVDMRAKSAGSGLCLHALAAGRRDGDAQDPTVGHIHEYMTRKAAKVTDITLTGK